MTLLTLRTAVVIIGVIFYVLVERKCSDVLASSSIRAELFRIPFVVCCIFLIFLEKIMWRQPWSGSIIVIRAAYRNSSLLHMTGFYVIMMIINVPFMFDSCVVHDYVYCILLNMIDFLVIICTVFLHFCRPFISCSSCGSWHWVTIRFLVFLMTSATSMSYKNWTSATMVENPEITSVYFYRNAFSVTTSIICKCKCLISAWWLHQASKREVIKRNGIMRYSTKYTAVTLSVSEWKATNWKLFCCVLKHWELFGVFDCYICFRVDCHPRHHKNVQKSSSC